MKAATIDLVNEALGSNQPTVLYFSAAWCAPCRSLGPKMDEMANLTPNINFLKVDVDTQRELAAKYGVMSIPQAFLITNGGTTHQKFMGGDLHKDLGPTLASM